MKSGVHLKIRLLLDMDSGAPQDILLKMAVHLIIMNEDSCAPQD